MAFLPRWWPRLAMLWVYLSRYSPRTSLLSREPSRWKPLRSTQARVTRDTLHTLEWTERDSGRDLDQVLLVAVESFCALPRDNRESLVWELLQGQRDQEISLPVDAQQRLQKARTPRGWHWVQLGSAALTWFARTPHGYRIILLAEI